MEIMKILQDSLIFPSKNLTKLALYIAFTVVYIIFFVLALLFAGSSIESNVILLAILSVVFFIVCIILLLILNGYAVSIIKTGIGGEDSASEFKWKENCLTGIKYFVVDIIYYIIPSIIVLIVGLITNLFGSLSAIFSEMAKTNIESASMNATFNSTVAMDAVPQYLFADFGNAIMITGVVAIILFLIFTFFKIMALSRLANTDSLGEALNISEAVKDMGRIGWSKVIAVVILIYLITFVVNIIISSIANYVPAVIVLSIIVTPYLLFFSNRAYGLLYSDIA